MKGSVSFKLILSLHTQYADPVANLLDKWGVFRARLFRESCVFHRGNYVKDLSRLGRDLHKVVIMDNSPASYIFHPDNAVSLAFCLTFIMFSVNWRLGLFPYGVIKQISGSQGVGYVKVGNTVLT